MCHKFSTYLISSCAVRFSILWVTADFSDHFICIQLTLESMFNCSNLPQNALCRRRLRSGAVLGWLLHLYVRQIVVNWLHLLLTWHSPAGIDSDFSHFINLRGEVWIACQKFILFASVWRFSSGTVRFSILREYSRLLRPFHLQSADTGVTCIIAATYLRTPFADVDSDQALF